MDNTVKEPLIHLSKREDMSFGKKWLVRIIADSSFSYCMCRFYFHNY